jgi:hypothetical protein
MGGTDQGTFYQTHYKYFEWLSIRCQNTGWISRLGWREGGAPR